MTIISVFILATLSSSGQKKFEQERRISQDEVHSIAVEAYNSLAFKSRVKWYEEISDRGRSFEAKTKVNGVRYSVEFDESGGFQDVEITIPSKELPEDVHRAIYSALQDASDKHRIRKIQLQLTGTFDAVRDHLVTGNSYQGVTCKYELIVSIRKDGTLVDYEYLFDDSGSVEKRSELIDRPADNLLY